MIVDEGGIMCFAAKWKGERSVYFSRDIADAHAFLDEADAVVGWNSDRFDIPRLNREFHLRGLGVPSPYAAIDLIKTVRKRFGFPSNKLDHVAFELLGQRKVAHQGFSLWTACMNEDEAAWKKMERYNKQDVRLTEKIYDDILPWVLSHPNVLLRQPAALDTTKQQGGGTNSYLSGCRTCGSSHLEKRGTAYTADSSFQRYRCKKCGSWSRGNKRLLMGEVRDAR